MVQFKINLAQGAISFNFTVDGAKNLQKEIDRLMDSLKTVANASTTSEKKPKPQKPMEYQYTGDVFFEVFCNPNIYASPFAAKVLLTIRDEKIRLTAEAELPRLVDDLHEYIEQVD